MKIVVLDGERENPGDLSWDAFEKLGKLVVYDNTAPEEVEDRIKGFDAVIVNKVKLNESNLKDADTVKYIGVLATGYNVIDIEYAKKRGIVVTNVPAYGTEAVAQFAMALLLEICCHVGFHDRLLHDGTWSESGKWSYWERPLIELKGKTIGIIGMGRIGKTMSKLSKAMGMNVIYHDMIEYPGEEFGTFVTIEDLYENADVISLHCPAFPSTYNMINKDTIAKMKDGVIIINNGRGQLINEEDLAEALNSGKVYAAGLDVAKSEPIEKDNPLLKAKNCYITPHISWAALESRARIMEIAASNLDSFMKGGFQNNVWI